MRPNDPAAGPRKFPQRRGPRGQGPRCPRAAATPTAEHWAAGPSRLPRSRSSESCSRVPGAPPASQRGTWAHRGSEEETDDPGPAGHMAAAIPARREQLQFANSRDSLCPPKSGRVPALPKTRAPGGLSSQHTCPGWICSLTPATSCHPHSAPGRAPSTALAGLELKGSGVGPGRACQDSLNQGPEEAKLEEGCTKTTLLFSAPDAGSRAGLELFPQNLMLPGQYRASSTCPTLLSPQKIVDHVWVTQGQDSWPVWMERFSSEAKCRMSPGMGGNGAQNNWGSHTGPESIPSHHTNTQNTRDPLGPPMTPQVRTQAGAVAATGLLYTVSRSPGTAARIKA
ncbi:uncharacterized protein LOC121459422 isoform X1 [Microtus oregoni]|uniref:uncharacterized protein LOC121459422 isoform X1 n=1 Tax=Microtus oregoni TaxID=111838 RepID=UPI001BB230D7|nr:uncharacterized protein LOC121459422 isoform X1 [Microtus oregoni]